MDPRCKIAILLGKTRTDGPVHKQQSMVCIDGVVCVCLCSCFPLLKLYLCW